jgi:NADH-quinone oxidoreductase subunit G
LTEREFRFKARVWYLSSAPSLCNGCSTGCNIDVHFVLDRPHLNDGARVLRLKPRVNPDVNEWWMCDEGRFGFHWIDRARLTKVRQKGADSNWEAAFSGIRSDLAMLTKIGVIASSQLTTEELFLIREIFQSKMGARVAAPPLKPAGKGDDFLLEADRNPNTQGAKLLGLDGTDAASLVADAVEGRLEALWVFGHDLRSIADEKKIQELSQKLRLFVFSGTNENPTASFAHWVLPTAAYVEKDGTFVSKKGRVQRIGRAFPPLPDSREDWSVLLEIARRLNHPLAFRKPQEIFLGLASTVPAFAGLSYDAIGAQGVELNRT